MRCFLISICCLLLGNVSISQTYHFDNYSVKDGLSQSTVYAITQDDNGNVWLGNKTGVSKFDGTVFSNYTIKDGLSGNGVRSVFRDSSDNIWFGHLLGGLSRFRDGAFEVIELKENEINTDISGITQDALGRIWISTAGNGVYRIDNPDKKSIEEFKIAHFIGKDGISDRVFNSARIGEHIFFVTDVGIKKLNHQSDKFETHSSKNLSTFFQFTTIFEDSDQNIWYGTYNGGLYKQFKGSDKFEIFDIRDGLAGNWVSCLAEDAQGRIWVGTWGGGISVIENDEILTFNKSNGLNDLKIFDMRSDREGNMLIGSNESGLFVFKGDHFVAYTIQNGLSNDQVWSVLKDKYDKTWIGTSEGITLMEKKNGEVEYTYITESGNNFISNDIRFLKEDNQGNIWVGTWGGGIIKVNPANPKGPYEYPSRLNSSIRYQMVTAMDIDKDNNLWVGTLDGLLYYEINTGRMSYLTSINGLAGNEISEVYCDKKGVAWIGCKGKGLTIIEDTTFSQFDLGGDITPNAIKEDNDGNIWIGTDGQGLIISKDRRTLTDQFNTEDGLLANLINLLEIDKENNIWIGTNKGLNKFNREDATFLSFTEADGFIGIETKSRSSFMDKEGALWFGTVHGIMKYDPKKDKTGQNLPLVKITKLKVNLNDEEIKNGREFTYKEKSFYFDFKGIYLSNPKSVRYKYMLEGIDADWSAPTSLTFASYPALPDGKYVFKVMASNNSAKWTEVPASYEFVINPPFWKTWWFYLFCVVFFGSWIYYLIKKREESLIMEKKLLEEKVEERTAEIVDKNKELASKNKDITDSIRYAERIQRAILPPTEEIKANLPDSFVLYRPKDIVSGDFYWVSKSNDKALFAAVDCTGHGVPGAFMSIVGHNLLDKIVKEEKIDKPSLILDSLNNSVSETLRQKSEFNEVKDGMDLGLVRLDHKNMKLDYAGAHNPLYIYRKKELIEVKADKYAIGSFIRGEKRKFTNHEITLEKNDVIYVFSDGFPDQFGGPEGKKYKYKPFKDFLLNICDKEMSVQKELLEREFVEWLGDHEQIDDVIIFGVRV